MLHIPANKGQSDEHRSDGDGGVGAKHSSSFGGVENRGDEDERENDFEVERFEVGYRLVGQRRTDGTRVAVNREDESSCNQRSYVMSSKVSFLYTVVYIQMRVKFF